MSVAAHPTRGMTIITTTIMTDMGTIRVTAKIK